MLFRSDGNPVYQQIGVGPLDAHFAACINELQSIITDMQAKLKAAGVAGF